MSTVVVLAMHGVPPGDFPRNEAAEMFSLHARLEHASDDERRRLAARHHELEQKMRAWPRTEANDPYCFASQELARELSVQTGYEVFVGFNEFCGPSLDEALDRAAEAHPDQVLVVTPMMTRGGGHSERDIPGAIARARARYPWLNVRYLWPFPSEEIARFLAAQIAKTR